MYKYKNISGLDQSVIGLGLVPADKEFTSPVEINNPNFELLSGEQAQATPIQTNETVETKESQENGA